MANKPTAPCEGSTTNPSTKGHVLGAGTDVRCNRRTPHWAALDRSHAPGTAGWFKVQSGAVERSQGSHCNRVTLASFGGAPGTQHTSREARAWLSGDEPEQVLKAWGAQSSKIRCGLDPAEHLIPLSWSDPQDGKML